MIPKKHPLTEKMAVRIHVTIFQTFEPRVPSMLLRAVEMILGVSLTVTVAVPPAYSVAVSHSLHVIVSVTPKWCVIDFVSVMVRVTVSVAVVVFVAVVVLVTPEYRVVGTVFVVVTVE
jgi:hypothetical protein